MMVDHEDRILAADNALDWLAENYPDVAEECRAHLIRCGYDLEQYYFDGFLGLPYLRPLT